MTDDVEETLASLEQRLRALQAELDESDEGASPLGAPRAARPAGVDEGVSPLGTPPPEEPAPAPRRLAPRATPSPDALDRFGDELRRLVTVWERTAAELRGDAEDGLTFRGGVALEAHGDLTALCALDRALRDVPGVTRVTLRAYAGGAGALEVALEGEVALLAELRRSLAFDLVEVSGGRISMAVH